MTRRIMLRSPDSFDDIHVIDVQSERTLLTKRVSTDQDDPMIIQDWNVYEPQVVRSDYIKDRLLAIDPDVKIDSYIDNDHFLERTRAHINRKYFFFVDAFKGNSYYRSTVDYAILTLQRNMEKL